jgi:hypothetical protein
VIRRVVAAVALGAAAPGSPAGAQEVGHPPARSPFTDLEFRQNVSLIGGYFRAGKDPIGVAPRGGPMLGVQYDVGFGGPAILTTRVRTVASERTAIDPARPAGSRVLGTEQRPVTLVDVGLTLALTGQRSFHGIVPLLHTGVGAASNFAGADPGGFRFGTSFAFAYGLGARFVPRTSRLAFRADVGNTAYRVRYPDGYAAASLDGTPVLDPRARRQRYLNNTAVTAGVSYQFRR